MNRALFRLEWLRTLREPRAQLFCLLPLAGFAADARFLDLMAFGSFYFTGAVGWQRSSQQAAEDSFLLARGAVTRRGLTAVHLLLDAISIGFAVALAWGIYLWRNPQRPHGGLWLESIMMGVMLYSVVAVVLPRWRWSELAASALIIPPGVAGLSILISADTGALPILADYGFLPSFVRELRLPPLSVLVLISILCIAGNLAFPPGYDERSSVERRDAARGRSHSRIRSPRLRGPLAALVLAELRTAFLSQGQTAWMLAGAILIIGMFSPLTGYENARAVAHGFGAFMFFALAASWIPSLLGGGLLKQPSPRRSPLELLLTLPIARRRIYVVHALTLAASLGLIVAAGLALGAAWGGPPGAVPIGRTSLAIAAVSLAWVQLSMALLSHETLAAAGRRNLGQSALAMGLGMLGLAPFFTVGLGLMSSRVQHAAMFAVDYAVPISLALCALAVAIQYAACRRFEQLELG